jgi:exosome complex component RRP42
MINAELTPLSSEDYENGPPQIKAIELARVIDRGIREAKAIDLKKLCVVPGEKAWFVSIDLVTINDEGNLFDVCALAAIAALKSAKFPVVDKTTGVVNYKEKTDVSVPLNKEPLSVTIYLINGNLLVDPTIQEEKSYDARLTVASDAKGTISAMQKGGETPLTTEQVNAMVKLAMQKATELRAELTKQVK